MTSHSISSIPRLNQYRQATYSWQLNTYEVILVCNAGTNYNCQSIISLDLDLASDILRATIDPFVYACPFLVFERCQLGN